MGADEVPEGWYDDPLGKADERYWDGANWTQQVRERQVSGGSSAGPVVTPPPPPVTTNGSRGSRTIVIALFASLAVIGALVALLLTRSSGSPTESAETTTVLSTEAPSASTTQAPATTLAPTTTLAATTTTTAPATTTIATTTTIVDRAAAMPIQLTPSMISATCQGVDGIEGDLVTPVSYSPANLLDDVPATAWRCDTNEVLSGSLTIDLGVETLVTRLSMFAGYDKIDPYNQVDRYQQNHRAASVRWTFDDGSSVVASYEDVRRLQSVDVDVVTSTVRIEILDYWPSSGTLARDMIAISEVDVWGIR